MLNRVWESDGTRLQVVYLQEKREKRQARRDACKERVLVDDIRDELNSVLIYIIDGCENGHEKY